MQLFSAETRLKVAQEDARLDVDAIFKGGLGMIPLTAGLIQTGARIGLKLLNLFFPSAKEKMAKLEVRMENLRVKELEEADKFLGKARKYLKKRSRSRSA